MTANESSLRRFLAGDAAAFDEIVEGYQAGLLRFAAGLLSDHSAAQDVVQETFIRLLNSAGAVKDGTKLSSWLFRTCRNLAIDHIRKEKSVERLEQEATAEMQLHQEKHSVDGKVEKEELIQFVRERMTKLTPKECACIVLKLVEGKSYKEISEITGLSTSNVGFQIHNGLKRLSAFVAGSLS
jgi:RNA polymerase sigma factor (sigma-70 family)